MEEPERWLSSRVRGSSHLTRGGTCCSGRPERFPPKCGVKIVGGTAEGTGAALSDVVALLNNYNAAGRPVKDFTGLEGRFDFSVPLNGLAASALPKRFGLKLESRLGRERTVVVDNIERPSPN